MVSTQDDGIISYYLCDIIELCYEPDDDDDDDEHPPGAVPAPETQPGEPGP